MDETYTRKDIRVVYKGILAAVLLLLLSIPACAGSVNEYNILYLNSYHQGMDWSDTITSGVITGIHNELGDNGNLYIEYLDTKRYDSKEHYDQLNNLIKEKYQNTPIDCIIVSDDPALTFLKTHYNSLFNGIPVVFCGINYFTPDLIAFSPNVTGITEKKYIKESIDLAYSLNPAIKKVYVINDMTETGIQNKNVVLDIIPLYEGRISFEFLENYTMGELLDIIETLPPDAIVFLNTFARDREGSFFETHEVASLVTGHSSVPVYSSSDYYLGEGIVGGVMVPGNEQGSHAAYCAAEIVNGNEAYSIPIVIPEGVTRFDYNRLLFYGLSPDSLPPGSDIINRPSSDVEIPIAALILFTGLTTLLVFAIFILVYANGQLKRTRKSLEIQEERLRLAMNATEDGLYDWDLIHNRFFFSPGFIRMLGYADGEISPTFDGYTSLIHDEERDHVISEIENYLHQEKPGKFVHEFRMQKKDGTYIWIQSRGEIVSWQGEEPARMVGTQINITESRQYRQAIIEINKKLNILSSITRHDILNQITVLQGYFDLIKESVQDDLQCVTYLEKLHGVFDKIERQILFTRDYQNMGVEEPRWQHVEDTVNEAIKSLGNTNVTFCTRTENLFVFADSMLVRVLYNLYENAIRHGNNVTMIQTTFERRGNDGVLIVEDNGIGIPDTEKERIFEKGVGSNSGLGLFLVQNILAITGIEIKETGTYTKGARFEILIPPGKYRMSGQDGKG